MSGKWHLGNSQWKQTPVGRGFDVHVGSYSWGIDHYSKQFYQLPGVPLVTDWVKSFENGTYQHYADPAHSTDAVTAAAVEMMENHVHMQTDVSPLFLYVSYIAAHSPLQPAATDLQKCVHVPHAWRRQYCGLVVGLDRSIAVLMEQVQTLLGPDTLVVITSDNGGSSWFGGMNAPYRGEKTTPLQGGVLVPALLLDLSQGQSYITASAAEDETSDTDTPSLSPSPLQFRRYDRLMHVSDWFPTLLGFAGLLNGSESEPGAEVGLEALVAGMDGMDLSPAIRQFSRPPGSLESLKAAAPRTSPVPVHERGELLIDMFYGNESCFFDLMEAYVFGDLKYVRGVVPDTLWYRESPQGSGVRVLEFDVHPQGSPVPEPFSRPWLLTAYIHMVLGATELGVHMVEWLLGAEYGTFDTIKLYLVHSVAVPHVAASLHELNAHRGPDGVGYYLFNLTADPYEQHNLWREDHIEAVEYMETRLAQIASHRPLQQKYWMQLSPLEIWPRTFRAAGWGQHLPSSHESYRDRNTSALYDGSMFIHPWYSDLVPEEELTTHDPMLVSSIDVANSKMQAKAKMFAIALVVVILFTVVFKSSKKSNE